jgi:hypothetical protein
MKKCMIAGLAAALVLTVAWSAVGQPQGGGAGQGAGGGRGMGRGGFNKETQLKAVAALQEQAAKLKALIDSMPAMPAGGFQDMTDEDRTKMREIGEQRTGVVAAIQQQVDQLKGIRGFVTENQQAMGELKALQEVANKEKATETAKKIGEMITAKQKQLEDKAKAMGIEPDALQRMIDRASQRGPGQ